MYGGWQGCVRKEMNQVFRFWKSLILNKLIWKCSETCTRHGIFSSRPYKYLCFCILEHNLLSYAFSYGLQESTLITHVKIDLKKKRSCIIVIIHDFSFCPRHSGITSVFSSSSCVCLFNNCFFFNFFFISVVLFHNFSSCQQFHLHYQILRILVKSLYNWDKYSVYSDHLIAFLKSFPFYFFPVNFLFLILKYC